MGYRARDSVGEIKMTLLHDAYIALLAGLTTKTGNEIHWQDEERESITVEPIGISKEKYIVRRYYKNGNKEWEEEYQNGQRHGKSIEWDENGNKLWEHEYQNGLRHGKHISWNEKGNKFWEVEWKNGQLHGKHFTWYENGNRYWEREFQNGKLHGKAIEWDEGGNKKIEEEFQNGVKVK